MIYIAGDKHGLYAINFVKNYLNSHKIDYQNLGVTKEGEDMKLELMIPPVVYKVKEKSENRGILVCGTGIGVEVGANKFSGIRAALATNEKIAEWAGIYDKSNILCLVGWDATQEKINAILDSWLNAVYDGDKDRLIMFEEFDKWH